jgi:hypothetical protein
MTGFGRVHFVKGINSLREVERGIPCIHAGPARRFTVISLLSPVPEIKFAYFGQNSAIFPSNSKISLFFSLLFSWRQNTAEDWPASSLARGEFQSAGKICGPVTLAHSGMTAIALIDG